MPAGHKMLSITYKEFRQIADYIKSNYGIELKDEKQTMVAGRLQQLLQSRGLTSFSDFFQQILSDKSGASAADLIDKLTTNHTFFMREAEHFRFFRDQVLPYLSAAVKERDLRIWCSACSTGEESSTLAMLIDEYFGRDKIRWDTKLLATDISGSVLDTARRGIYSNDRVASLPVCWQMNYFKPYDHERSILTDRIRNDIIYRKLNLMDAVFPFKRKFHVIFCRNVMIYFDHGTKMDLIRKFFEQLETGGYLFIGHSESIPREETKLRYIMPSVYRKV